MKKQAEIGEILDNGLYKGGFNPEGEGYCYKDAEAFNIGKGVCYIGENLLSDDMTAESGFTREDLEDNVRKWTECHSGNPRYEEYVSLVSKCLFQELCWQHPDTLLGEWDMYGELDEMWNGLDKPKN